MPIYITLGQLADAIDKLQEARRLKTLRQDQVDNPRFTRTSRERMAMSAEQRLAEQSELTALLEKQQIEMPLVVKSSDEDDDEL